MLIQGFAVLCAVGGQWPPLDFYGQLQAQALLASAAATLAMLVVRRFWLAIIGLICALPLLANLYPYMVPPPRIEPIAGADAPLRLAWANLHNWSTGPEALATLLRVETPDIVVLTELSAHHRSAVASASDYVFRSTFPVGSAFDLLLMSRWRPTDLRFDYGHGISFPVMTVRFCRPEGAAPCLAIVALHAPRPPLPGGVLGEPATRRDRLLSAAAALARGRLLAGDQVVLLGDFNAAPYSTAFRNVLVASGLVDSGLAASEHPMLSRPTWFSSWPGIGLPIDHALISPGIRVVERRLGPKIGSDHRPLILHLRLASAP